MVLSVGGPPTGFILSDVVAGMNWVAANRIKPAVANASLGSATGSATLDTAVRGMHNAGVLRGGPRALRGCCRGRAS